MDLIRALSRSIANKDASRWFSRASMLSNTRLPNDFSRSSSQKVLNRIQLGRIGRRREKPHVLRDGKRSGFVPPGTIEHHDNSVGRMPVGYFVQEDQHAVALDVRQDKAIQKPSLTETAAYAYVCSCVTIALHIGRVGLGHQHRRVSDILPKRASS